MVWFWPSFTKTVRAVTDETDTVPEIRPEEESVNPSGKVPEYKL